MKFVSVSPTNSAQVRLLLPRKALRPRTFRIGAGHSVLIGGVARFDVLAAPAATIYLTLWASADVVTHFGKTDAAAERCGFRCPQARRRRYIILPVSISYWWNELLLERFWRPALSRTAITDILRCAPRRSQGLVAADRSTIKADASGCLEEDLHVPTQQLT